MSLSCPECKTKITVSGLSKHFTCSKCFAYLEGHFKGAFWAAIVLSGIVDFILVAYFSNSSLLFLKSVDLCVFLLLVAMLANIFGTIESNEENSSIKTNNTSEAPDGPP